MTLKNVYPVKPVAFNVMLKPIGPICNLNCTYCYYLEKKNLYKKVNDFRITDQILEKYIKDYIESQQVPVVSFVWQGGEPTLLGLDFFKKAVQLQQKYAGNKRIENAFQTNGTLLDENWCSFFRDNNFLVGISIDGPEHLHDYYRTYKAGDKPSFKDVMKGISLLQRYNTSFNTLTVVNKCNGNYPLEVYHFLKEIGSQFIQFIPIVERRAVSAEGTILELLAPGHGQANVTEWSVGREQYGDFLIGVFDEWVRQDVGKYYVQLFDVTLANWVGEDPGLCVFSETCGEALVMEHNGDIYSCDHFVYENYLLGNILDKPLGGMATSEQQFLFGENKRNSLPQYCLSCDYRFACHGECPKHRFDKTPDGEEGLNYLCQSYKKFFLHVHPYMQYMADELSKKRPPANVMQWVKKIDDRKSGNYSPVKTVSIGRNDPCPCGSGRKYKNCCINITKY